MKRMFFIGAFSIGLASCSLTNSNAQNNPHVNGEPKGIRIEAELPKPPGDNRIVADPTASGGAAISSDKAWEPVFQAAIPKGESFDVWLRHKYGPLIVKSVSGEQQTELIFLGGNEADWRWVNAGRFTKEQLGEKLLIIRGPQSENPSPLLDSVVFAAAGTGTANAPAPVAVPNARRPAGTLVEAEYPKPPGRNTTLDAADASGGQAVTSNVDWEPIFEAPVPSAGDAFTVWVRHKGGPFTLKSVLDDNQIELRTITNAPTAWTWTNAGRYTRAQLRAQLLIIKGHQDTGLGATLDAVVFSPQEGAPDAETLKLGKVPRALPTDQSDEISAPQNVAVEVDWAKRAGVMPADMWGANDYESLNPKDAADPVYQKQLADMKLPWVRLHQGAISDAWTSSKTRDWDAAKIKAGLDASTGYGNARLMMNIASWPGWLQEYSPNGILSEDKEDEFAALCARLVRVMRDDVKRPIAYWEVINEKELVYSAANRLPDLWRLFNKVAVAIKKEDPNAYIGGPAYAWPKTEWVEDFLKNCGSNIQFISWHRYVSFDIYEPNDRVLSKTHELAQTVKAVEGAVKKWVPNRDIEMLLTEYNIQAVWQPFERRHSNAIGAVFNASVLYHTALAGLDGSAVWHLKGNAYGLIDAQNKLRPGYHLYRWGTRYLTGEIVSATSDSKQLEVLPIKSADGRRALLFINKMPNRVSVARGYGLIGSKKPLTLNQIHGYDELAPVQVKTTDLNSVLVLPGYSLTLIRE